MAGKRRPQKSKNFRKSRVERRSPKLHGSDAGALGKGRVQPISLRQKWKRQIDAEKDDEIPFSEHVGEVVKKLSSLEKLDGIGSEIEGQSRLGRVIEVYKGHCLLEDLGPMPRELDEKRPPDDADYEELAAWSEKGFEEAESRVKSSGRGLKLVKALYRGLLQAFNLGTRNIVAAGDRVRFVMRFEPASERDIPGVIISREPRSSCLSRPAWGGVSVQHIAANMHQIIAVISYAEPDFKPGMMDRYAVYAESELINIIFVVNKVDLGPEDIEERIRRAEFPDTEGSEDPARVIRNFREMGYSVQLTSATEGWGLEELREALRNKVSVFSGHSGVGKSTLLTFLDPEFDLRRGEVSKITRKGRHVTSRATWMPLGFGGAVIDTPGIRSFGLYGIDQRMLPKFFVEFEPYLSGCRFPNCRHKMEPGCAVRSAVEAGRISRRRYDSYLRILKTLPDLFD